MAIILILISACKSKVENHEDVEQLDKKFQEVLNVYKKLGKHLSVDIMSDDVKSLDRWLSDKLKQTRKWKITTNQFDTFPFPYSERQDVSAIRFRWGGAFHPYNYLVQLEKNDSQVFVNFKTIVIRDYKAQTEKEQYPYRVIENKNFKVADSCWRDAVNLLSACEFWCIDDHFQEVGLDGSSWQLSAQISDRYSYPAYPFHQVSLWVPKDPGFVKACTYLLGLAGKNTENLFIY